MRHIPYLDPVTNRKVLAAGCQSVTGLRLSALPSLLLMTLGLTYRWTCKASDTRNLSTCERFIGQRTTLAKSHQRPRDCC